MTEYSLIATIAEKVGITGLVILAGWKLADRLGQVLLKLVDLWAGRFLEVHSKQAEAMGELASAVRSGQGEQRELLLAVRVMATKIDETMGLAREINKNCLARRADECRGF